MHSFVLSRKNLNQLAKFIVEQATDEDKEETPQPEKNPAAVAGLTKNFMSIEDIVKLTD